MLVHIMTKGRRIALFALNFGLELRFWILSRAPAPEYDHYALLFVIF